MAPTAILSPLNRADGSATYTSSDFPYSGYTIIGSVNGPIEVQRRDELPEEATLEVHVRMPAGVGSPRERYLESLVANVLRGIILMRKIPRTLVQVVLQVAGLPEEVVPASGSGRRFSNTLPLLPHLLHTALLSLLSASIPLSATLTSTLVALPLAEQSTPIVSPTTTHLAQPLRSLHVFAFSGNRKMLVSESEGEFSIEEWTEACEAAEDLCCKADGGVSLGEGMEVEGVEQNLEDWLRGVIKSKVEKEQKWKEAS